MYHQKKKMNGEFSTLPIKCVYAYTLTCKQLVLFDMDVFIQPI